MDRFVRFFLTMWVLFTIAIFLVVWYLPPDPYAQLPFLPVAFGIPLIASYWLVYRDGYATIRAKLA